MWKLILRSKVGERVASGARVWEKREERSWFDAPIPQSMGRTCGPKQKKRRGTVKYKIMYPIVRTTTHLPAVTYVRLSGVTESS